MKSFVIILFPCVSNFYFKKVKINHIFRKGYGYAQHIPVMHVTGQPPDKGMHDGVFVHSSPTSFPPSGHCCGT